MGLKKITVVMIIDDQAGELKGKNNSEICEMLNKGIKDDVPEGCHDVFALVEDFQ